MKAKARELMYPNQAAEANISAENVAQPVADALPAEAPPADEQRANGAPSHVPQPNLAQPYVDQVDMPPPPKIPAVCVFNDSFPLKQTVYIDEIRMQKRQDIYHTEAFLTSSECDLQN